MKSILLTISIFIGITLASCAGQTSKEQSAENTPDTTAAAVDSTAVADTVLTIDTLATDSVTPPPLPAYFATPAQALAFMADEQWKSFFEGSILPQMVRDYFPYAQRLLKSRYERFIVVDKFTMRVKLFDRYGRLLRSHKMACGRNYGTKHEKADERTPEGFFSVEGVYDSTDWLFTDDNGVTSKIKGQFGPRFVRLRIPGTTQIGIHGTCSPRSLGWRCSHGCIRITNEQILEFVEFVEPGMPVIVNPGRIDTRTNLEEGYDVPWISTQPDTARYRQPKFTPKPPVDTLINDSTVIKEIKVDTNAIKVDTLQKIDAKADSIKSTENLTVEQIR